MASSGLTKFVCALFLCMVLAAPYTEATITCGTVSSSLSSCLSYLTGKGPSTSACCSGISHLNSIATTTTDRQAACNCLKSLASGITGLNYNNAASLPGQCGVNIPYKISPTTNCAQVQ
ncbi:non-specific lipid-transfer protein 1-like [Silene latifolia]|uniref:non-specific lipid-transfer protein 1-like n=1 Tax=Silene latifolia TaxID=37657 RepID=UPI003D78056C